MPSARTETITVSASEAGTRLDKFISDRLPYLSRTHVQGLIATGQVLIDGAGRRGSYRVRDGDELTLTIPAVEPSTLAPEDIPLSIIYEDEDIAVIDKPAHLVVHPAPGHPSGTLVNAILARYPDLSINGSVRPGIVHRLDRDTSGVMVVAKSDRGKLSLVEQMKDRRVLKEYLALVEGVPELAEARIEGPIARSPFNRKKMAVVPSGRPAQTQYRVVQRFRANALLRVRIFTGRTHQIRVHLAHIGHPVVGDPLYGRRKPSVPLDRPFLHAARLGFRLPRTGEYVEFSAPLPAELENVLESLRGGAVA